MSNRSREYYRCMARRKALRKRRISKAVFGWEYYDNIHQYSKNKIHCSCPDCSTKTRNKGKRKKGNYCRAINYKGTDLIKQTSMDEQMYEYNGKKIRRSVKYW